MVMAETSTVRVLVVLVAMVAVVVRLYLPLHILLINALTGDGGGAHAHPG